MTMKMRTGPTAIAPARMLLSRNSRPRVGSIVSLDSSSTGDGRGPNRRTVTGFVSSFFFGPPADRRLVRDLDLAAGDRLIDHGRRDDDRVEHDRELLLDMRGGPRGEELVARILEVEVHGPPAVAIRAQRRRLELVAGEQDADGRDRARTAARGHAGQVERLAASAST